MRRDEPRDDRDSRPQERRREASDATPQVRLQERMEKVLKGRKSPPDLCDVLHGVTDWWELSTAKAEAELEWLSDFESPSAAHAALIKKYESIKPF